MNRDEGNSRQIFRDRVFSNLLKLVAVIDYIGVKTYLKKKKKEKTTIVIK